MAMNFLACDREQPFLMPPDPRDWLPEDHLAWFLLASVEQMDLAAFYDSYRMDGWGRAAFEPSMMGSLLLYVYARGERSSRGIERKCVEDVAYRVIAAQQKPDHATIARFRARHAAAGVARRALHIDARDTRGRLRRRALPKTQGDGRAGVRADQAQPTNRQLPTTRQIRRTLGVAPDRRHPQPIEAPQAPDRRHSVAAGKQRNEELALDPIGLHECRHTYASFLMAAGYTLRELMEYMGHSSLQATERYVKLLPPPAGRRCRRPPQCLPGRPRDDLMCKQCANNCQDRSGSWRFVAVPPETHQIKVSPAKQALSVSVQSVAQLSSGSGSPRACAVSRSTR